MTCSRLQQLPDAAQREDARLRALFGALGQPAILASTDGHVVHLNTAAADLFADPEHLVGQPVHNLLPFVSIESKNESNNRAGWLGAVVDKTGRSIDIEVTRTRLLEGNSPPVDVYVLHDVSQHVELQRLREHLLYSAAHELRGPITALENSLDILVGNYADMSVSELQRMLQAARRTATRLRSLTESLLSVGSIQSGRFQVRPRQTMVRTVIDDALEMVGPILETRGQKVEVEMPGDGLMVLADRKYACQVLYNLLSNASKYSPREEIVRIKVEQSDNFVKVAVEDRGPGIAPEEQSKLFERFYRVKGTEEEPGMGLGLGIAKGIVDAHGGAIGVDSKVGEGTRVWFTLPLARGSYEGPIG
ncbi:MAG: PAS domain-containing sensor histidine kinase [Chloroflexi bacterium]|nr:PAS domain-containing sensor histidine kinase [Chloroflexota bacterium]